MRWDIINYLVEQNKYKKYLEIGVQDYESNCRKINTEYKYAVDPAPRGFCNFIGTSDKFFEQHDINDKFDIVFIDGLHHSDQVVRDIENSLLVLSEGGSIVVHDCLPEAEYQQVYEDNGLEWTGDVWKAMVFIKSTRPDLDVRVVDQDWGCGIIKFGKQELLPYNKIEDLNWPIFKKYRNEILNVITLEEFFNIYSNEQD
jgi:hypothetical protein